MLSLPSWIAIDTMPLRHIGTHISLPLRCHIINIHITPSRHYYYELALALSLLLLRHYDSLLHYHHYCHYHFHYHCWLRHCILSLLRYHWAATVSLRYVILRHWLILLIAIVIIIGLLRYVIIIVTPLLPSLSLLPLLLIFTSLLPLLPLSLHIITIFHVTTTPLLILSLILRHCFHY